MSDDLRIEFFCSQSAGNDANQPPVFYAGQLVQGRVMLILAESMKAKSVNLHINGRAMVHWTETEHVTRHDSKGKTYTDTHHIYYNSVAHYIKQDAVLWNGSVEQQEQIPAGQHIFPFTFTVPAHCPPSFEGVYGNVRYTCSVAIDRPWKFDKKAKAVFIVSPYVDLNTIDGTLRAVEQQKQKDIGIFLFKHGKLTAKLRLPRTGFVPGERIPLEVEVDNATTKTVQKVKAKLVENVIYVAQRDHTLQFDLTIPMSWGSTQHFAQRTSARKVAKIENEFNVAAQSKGTFQGQLQIPPCVPSFNTCPLIKVEYVLEVKVCTNATLGSSASLVTPLLIGTIPVRMQQQQMPLSPPPAYPQHPQPTAPQFGGGGGIYPTLDGAGEGTNGVQPSAPPAETGQATSYPTIGPPPSYEQSVFGTVKDDGMEYAPRYPFYRDL